MDAIRNIKNVSIAQRLDTTGVYVKNVTHKVLRDLIDKALRPHKTGQRSTLLPTDLRENSLREGKPKAQTNVNQLTLTFLLFTKKMNSQMKSILMRNRNQANHM
jgi:hypothetical protein